MLNWGFVEDGAENAIYVAYVYKLMGDWSLMEICYIVAANRRGDFDRLCEGRRCIAELGPTLPWSGRRVPTEDSPDGNVGVRRGCR